MNLFLYSFVIGTLVCAGPAGATPPLTSAAISHGTCDDLLAHASLARAHLGTNSGEGALLYRFVVETAHRLQHEVKPKTGDRAPVAILHRAQIALVDYVRLHVLPTLAGLRDNLGLASDPSLGEEWQALTRDEHRALTEELRAHAGQVERRIENALYGPEANDTLIFELGPSPKLAFEGGYGIEAMARMYAGLAARRGWNAEIVDERFERGELRNMTLKIVGSGAKRELTREGGVHRFISVGSGVSIADRNKTHTRYVGVTVYPEPEFREFVVDSGRFKIETFRASGPGGQHVNTTDSAVRVRDPESGLEVTVSSGRSQHRNQALALEILKSKLYARHLAALEAERRLRLKLPPPAATARYVRTYDTRYDRVALDAVLGGDLEDELAQRRKEQLRVDMEAFIASGSRPPL